jgi:hypothetical protein
MTDLQKALINNINNGGNTISLTELENENVVAPLRTAGVYDFKCTEVTVTNDSVMLKGICTNDEYNREHSITLRAYGDGTFFRAQMEDILQQVHQAPVGFKIDLIKDLTDKEFIVGASYNRGYINYTFNVKQLISMLNAEQI